MSKPCWLTPGLLPPGFFPLMTAPACREAPKVETSEFPLTAAAPLISYLCPNVSSSSRSHHHLSSSYNFLLYWTVENALLNALVLFIFHFSHSSFPSVSSTDNMLFKTWDFYKGSFLCLLYPPLHLLGKTVSYSSFEISFLFPQEAFLGNPGRIIYPFPCVLTAFCSYLFCDIYPIA